MVKLMFLNYVDEKLLSKSANPVAGQSVPIEHIFTEREFLFPPEDTAEIIWDKFKGMLEPMADCSFWGYMVINMMRKDYIEPAWLAAELNGTKKNRALYA